MMQSFVVLLVCGLLLCFAKAIKVDIHTWNAAFPNQILSKGFQSVLSKKKDVKMSDSCAKEILSAKFKSLMPQYLDASGKPGSNYLHGNILWLGSYQECQTSDGSKYCLGHLQLSFSNTSLPYLGICVPKGCNESDVFLLLELGMKALNISKSMSAREVLCTKIKEYNTGFKVSMTLFGFILLLVFFGTITQIVKDIYHTRSPNNDEYSKIQYGTIEKTDGNQSHSIKGKGTSVVVKILLSFSLIKNTEVIWNTDVPQGAITSLSGIRLFSMWWIIFGHLVAGFVNKRLFISDNPYSGMHDISRFTGLPFINADVSVDSFFLLSGLLVSYLSMRRFEKHGKLPLLPFYLHRFVRLAPVYIIVIIFYTYVFPYMEDSPIWSLAVTDDFTQPCKDYWWTNLLFINNMYPGRTEKMCLDWTWYLANDMQFYIISPIFLYAMYKFKIRGALASIGATLMVSFIVTGLLMGHYNLIPFDVRYNNEDGVAVALKYLKYVYFKPYCRVPPYLVGMLVGYLLHRKTTIQGNLKWVYGMIGWAVAATLALTITYSTWPYYRIDKVTPSKFVNVTYGTFSHFIWGVAIAWVVYACHTRLGGYINNFLSWKAFIPLSRLTYNVYMTHVIVIQFFTFGRSTPFHFTPVHTAIYFMAAVVASYACAFLLAVTVEMPFANLEKLAFKF